MFINDNWISLCIKGNIKELDIHIISDDVCYYTFPLSVIHDSRTLTTFKLEDVALEDVTFNYTFEEDSASGEDSTCEEDLDVCGL